MEATDDLRDLLQWTLETWGRDQRDAYRHTIRQSLQRLSRFPYVGRRRDELGSELRILPVGHHSLVYRVGDTEIIVIRIMHVRQAPPEQLV